MKDAASTPKGAQRQEFVEAIVNHLKPWKDDKSRDTVTVAVKERLDLLLELVPLQKKFFDRTANRDHARKLDKALSKVQELVKSSPGLLAVFLFDPRLALIQSDDNGPSDRFQRELLARAVAFGVELKRLREVCARVQNYGVHPNYDHAKNLSAQFSYHLIREYSDRKITGTVNQPFRTIASLIYEVVSDQKDADLKRSCDEVLHETRPDLYRTTN